MNSEISTALAEQTVELGQSSDLNVVRLAAYLAQEATLPRIATVRRFQGGQSNPTYLLIADDGSEFVLRKKPSGAILPSAHQVEREYRVMQALALTNVPVPHVYLLCENPEIIGTPFFIMNAVPGRLFRDPTLPKVPVAERRGVYLGMADVLAKLHAVDWKSVGLDGFGRPADYFKRQVARWSGQVANGENQPFARLSAWLADNIPPEERATIVHGDYRLENLVFDAERPLVLATLDWELATIGQPLADLAYNCLPFHLPSRLKGLGGIADLSLGALGLPSEAEYVAAYCSSSGRDVIPNWNFYLAFSLFRTAAILHGVFERAQRNNASSRDALEVGGNYAEVAEIALNIASRSTAGGIS